MNRSSKIFVEHALEGYGFEVRPKGDWCTARSVTSTFFFSIIGIRFIIFY